MKRRDFLKLLSLAPIAPSVLVALPKKESLTEEVLEEAITEFSSTPRYILYSGGYRAGRSYFYNLWLENTEYRIGDQWPPSIFKEAKNA